MGISRELTFSEVFVLEGAAETDTPLLLVMSWTKLRLGTFAKPRKRKIPKKDEN
jgi:hypothetical protein